MKHVLSARTKQVDDSIVFEEGDEPSIWQGSMCIAQEGMPSLAYYAKLAMKIQEIDGPVAIIGLGLGILPRLLNRNNVSVWEIEPAIADFFNEKHPLNKCKIVSKAWPTNANLGSYAGILDDTGLEIQGLEQYLAPGGKIIKG